MWLYLQTGRWVRNDKIVCVDPLCYAGHGPGRNNPLLESTANIGPIPRGVYLLGTVEENGPHGPVAIHLVPCTGNRMYGRSGFLVHGDNIRHDASCGCPVAPLILREEMAASPDKQVIVLAGNEPVGKA